jgi:hypothetical protein
MNNPDRKNDLGVVDLSFRVVCTKWGQMGKKVGLNQTKVCNECWNNIKS